MSIRQYDTWVVDCYLTEAGWDGEHWLIYLETKRDAESVASAIDNYVLNHAGEDQRLSTLEVYKADRIPSFRGDMNEATRLGNEIAEGWFD